MKLNSLMRYHKVVYNIEELNVNCWRLYKKKKRNEFSSFHFVITRHVSRAKSLDNGGWFRWGHFI